MTGVAALLIGSEPGEGALDLAAHDVSEAIPVPSLAALVDAARSTTAPLLWIVDSAAEPTDGALEALLAADVLPAVSVPLGADGRPIEALIGRFADTDSEQVLGAVQKRQMPLRHTRVVSMLVERESVLALGPPDPVRFGDYAGSEWTARLFTRRPGMLVTASKVRVPATSPRAGLVRALRMARTGSWRRGETLRELHRSVTG